MTVRPEIHLVQTWAILPRKFCTTARCAPRRRRRVALQGADKRVQSFPKVSQFAHLLAENHAFLFHKSQKSSAVRRPAAKRRRHLAGSARVETRILHGRASWATFATRRPRQMRARATWPPATARRDGEPLLDARSSQRIRFTFLQRSPLNTLDLKDIKELISLMRKNDLSEFRLEQEGFKITLKRGVDFPALPASALPQLSYAPQPALPPPPSAGGGQAPAPEAKEKLREITSPMIGTFYAAASPESAPFASVGKEIADGTVVCIIEAMKVMNEIKSEIDGTIVEVVAENGKPVAYGQVLFRVR